LAALANAQWPTLVLSPFALAYTSRWHVISCSPGLDEVPPTRDEISEALVAVEALRVGRDPGCSRPMPAKPNTVAIPDR
jgi:hypothetical protein